MRPRFTRIPRWAWLASLTLHLMLAGGVYWLLASAPTPTYARNTTVQTDDPFDLSLARPGDEPPAPSLPVPVFKPEPVPSAEPVSISVATGHRPTVLPVPPALPREMQSLLRDLSQRPAPGPAVAAVEEFPIPEAPTPTPAQPQTDKPLSPTIQQTEFSEPANPTAGGSTEKPSEPQGKLAGGKPLHGALAPGKVAVYLLDRSASMGLNRETFDAARADLIATVKGTEESFQVVTYHASASVLVKGTAGKLLKPTEPVIAEVIQSLSELKPEGNSAHEAGLKAAIDLGADYVIWLTDASADELATAKRALKAAKKPVAVYVSRVTNGRVSEPELFR